MMIIIIIVGISALASCTSLTSLNIPSSVTLIGTLIKIVLSIIIIFTIFRGLSV